MHLNAKERAVESALYGVMSVGGVIGGYAMLGQLLEHQAEAHNATSQAELDRATQEANIDRAILGGCAVLALPGIWRLYTTIEADQPVAARKD